MQRLALYASEQRFEWAYWDGAIVQSGGDASFDKAMSKLEAALPTDEKLATIADVVYGQWEPFNGAAASELLPHALYCHDNFRRAGCRPRELPIFGWARTMAVRNGYQRVTVILRQDQQAQCLSYLPREDNVEYTRRTNEGVDFKADEQAPVWEFDTRTSQAGTRTPTNSTPFHRYLRILPEYGAIALGLLHSDIAVSEEREIESTESDRDIEYSIARVMDKVFDKITMLGYDLDDGICRRELEMVNTATGKSIPIEAPMRISRAELIEHVATKQSWAQSQIEIRRLLVTGFIQPLCPDGQHMDRIMRNATAQG